MHLPETFWSRPIQAETLDRFAYTNEALCPHPKGIVLEFHGLGGNPPIQQPETPSELAQLCAVHDLLWVFPFYGPWSWMNDTGVSITNEIVQAALARFGLPTSAPVISTGGSMGGLSALIYTRYADANVVACAARAPVCDLVFHCSERPDLPRTIYNAFKHYPAPFLDAVQTASPLHQAGSMPPVPYYIVHGEADRAVGLEPHSRKLVKALQARGFDVTLETVPGMDHVAPTGGPLARYNAFIVGGHGA